MEDKLRLYTDLTITKKTTGNLKRYFNSIRRNLPQNWFFLKDEKYADIDTFLILNEVVCLKTPYLTNQEKNITLFGKIFLGLTDDSIIILKITFSENLHKNENFNKSNSIGIVAHVINVFHKDVLSTNKYYNAFNYHFEFGGPTDENWNKYDKRDERSLKYYSKVDDKTYFFAKGAQVKLRDKEIIFFPPNNIALSLSLMKKSLKQARTLREKLITSNSSKLIKLEEKDKTILYGYFEEVFTSIIFSYTSVEAMANAAIPEDYKFEKINEKGISEVWSKENIERWMSTSQKVGNLLPGIFKSGDIKKQPFWLNFKQLEKLRNEIAHQKTIENGTKLDSKIYKEMLCPNIFKIISSSILIIKYFYDYENSHPFFPLGLGIAKFQIEEVSDIHELFKEVVEVT